MLQHNEFAIKLRPIWPHKKGIYLLLKDSLNHSFFSAAAPALLRVSALPEESTDASQYSKVAPSLYLPPIICTDLKKAPPHFNTLQRYSFRIPSEHSLSIRLVPWRGCPFTSVQLQGRKQAEGAALDYGGAFGGAALGVLVQA